MIFFISISLSTGIGTTFSDVSFTTSGYKADI